MICFETFRRDAHTAMRAPQQARCARAIHSPRWTPRSSINLVSEFEAPLTDATKNAVLAQELEILAHCVTFPKRCRDRVRPLVTRQSVRDCPDCSVPPHRLKNVHIENAVPMRGHRVYFVVARLTVRQKRRKGLAEPVQQLHTRLGRRPSFLSVPLSGLEYPDDRRNYGSTTRRCRR